MQFRRLKVRILPSVPLNRIEDDKHQHILQTIFELKIPIIKIKREVISNHSVLSSTYPFSLIGHYNTKEYRLVAEAIYNRLNKDLITPLNLTK